MGQEQEQEPFLFKRTQDRDGCAVKPPSDISRGPIARSSFKINLIIHCCLVAVYTICSIVAIHVLSARYMRTCKQRKGFLNSRASNYDPSCVR